MPKNMKRKVLYGGYLLLATLLLLEIGVRLVGFSERHIYDPIYTSFEQSEEIPYIHKSNLTRARARGLAMINTDSLGLRAETPGMVYGLKQSNEYRIAIVGDSNTFGEGVSRTEETFVQVLEQLLNQQQRRRAVKAFNFGASAYSVQQMAATLQHRMMKIQPDMVVMAIIPNDFNLSRTPGIDAAGYLVDQRIALFLDSPIRHILRTIHLMYVLREIGSRWLVSPIKVAPLLTRGKIPESYRYLQQFQETAEKYGLEYLIVLLPRMQANSWGILPHRLSEDGIRYVDLTMIGKEFTQQEFLASRFDIHASPAVHRRIGEALADYLRPTLELLP
jgi:lysophospholipase L1-like esterase